MRVQITFGSEWVNTVELIGSPEAVWLEISAGKWLIGHRIDADGHRERAPIWINPAHIETVRLLDV